MALCSVFLIGGHLLDIGDIKGRMDGFMINLISKHNLPYNYKSGLTNGFFTIDAVKIQHIGYYSMYLAFFALLITHIKNNGKIQE